MMAGVFARPGVLEIQDRPVPVITQADKALLEVEATGVCGTDLHILNDPLGHTATEGPILGHEIVARIAKVGEGVTQYCVGQRVTVDANLKCGLCKACKKGKWNHCINWTTIGIFQDGGFAKYVVVPQKALHVISDSVALKGAIWTELLSCVIGSTDCIAIQPGQTAAVIGVGPAGMLHALMFQAAGANVFIVDVAPYRLNLAKNAGIEPLNVKEENLKNVVMSFTDNWGGQMLLWTQ